MRPKVPPVGALFAFVWLALVCAFSTANAQETCSAEATPITGWRAVGGVGNILDDQGTTYDAVADIVEARGANAYRAMGWTFTSLGRHFWQDGGPERKYIKYDYTAIDQYGEPHSSDTDDWQVEVAVDNVCPKGYALTYASGSAQCVATNINLRECSTEAKPDKNRGCNAGAMEGNPCNLATGNKFQIEWDYPGIAGSHLQYARYYNSDASTPRGGHHNRCAACMTATLSSAPTQA